MSKSIFIFEFVAGGGFNNEKIPTSLLCEGFSMLRSIIEDFGKFHFKINTLLDYRIRLLSNFLEADEVHIVHKNSDFLEDFKASIRHCEFCFIIAPEFSGILKQLTNIANRYNKTLFSIDIKGINLASSKINTFQFFKSHNLPTPETILIPNLNKTSDKKAIFKDINNVEFPAVLKPDDGVGAELIFYLNSKKELAEFIDKSLANLEVYRDYVLQSYINGRDLSVLLFNNTRLTNEGKHPLILSINNQDIHIKGSQGGSEYLGGAIPSDDYGLIKKKLHKLLKNPDFKDFNGIFGVDFMYTDREIYLIEINPRLTTSYIGLRYVLNENPVELLINSSEHHSLHDSFKLNHHSIFKRVELKYNGIKTPEEVQSIIIPTLSERFPTEFITPPFSLKKETGHYSCFLATREEDKEGSLKKMDKIYAFLKQKGFLLC